MPTRDAILMTFTLLVPFTAIGALGGCDPDPLSIDELPAEEERVICAREVACGGALDQSTCESTVFLVESGKTATGIAAVKRGTLAYDSAQARRCLDAITTDCTIRRDAIDLCERIVTGKVAVGGACLLDDECADGGDCVIPSCPNACCPGTCAASTRPAPVPLGGSCAASGAECVSGAACLDGICAPPRAVGAACRGGLGECAAPAVCLAIPGGTETCTVLPTSRGAPCEPGANFGCGRVDERCDGPSRTCVPLSKPGSPCETIGDCVGYAYCDAGACKVRPTIGQPCDTPIEIQCMGSLVCVQGVCAAPTLPPACLSTGASL
jgi:hypothetical protein